MSHSTKHTLDASVVLDTMDVMMLIGVFAVEHCVNPAVVGALAVLKQLKVLHTCACIFPKVVTTIRTAIGVVINIRETNCVWTPEDNM